MILLWGIPSESPVERVAVALAARHARVFVLNQRHLPATACDWHVAGGAARGTLTVGGVSVALEDIRGVYVRSMDPQFVPEMTRATPDVRAAAQAAHEAFATWCDIAPARVVNRLSAMGSNSSKPYQARIIARHGFLVPETLVTNDPSLVRAFAERHGTIVYKSVSGVRSIVRRFGPEDASRLDRLRVCPVQFQQCVAGAHVRVHVVGDRVFATAIDSPAVDYRYAHRDGLDADLQVCDLDDDVAERCVRLADGLDLAFAGIDLCRTADGDWYCFEANPSPGFSYFESATGQPIADAVAAYLVG